MCEKVDTIMAFGFAGSTMILCVALAMLVYFSFKEETTMHERNVNRYRAAKENQWTKWDERKWRWHYFWWCIFHG